LDSKKKVSITIEAEKEHGPKSSHQFNVEYSTALLMMQSDKISRNDLSYRILSKEVDVLGNIIFYAVEIDKTAKTFSFE